jgi:hypothetical protein
MGFDGVTTVGEAVLPVELLVALDRRAVARSLAVFPHRG